MVKLCHFYRDGSSIEYILDISNRTRSYLSVRDGRLTVRLPYGADTKYAEQFIASHLDWIEKKLAESSSRSSLPKRFENGEEFSLLGIKRKLTIEQSPVYKVPQLLENELILYVSDAMDKADIRRLFMDYIGKLCTERVKRAFDEFIPKLGLAPKKITIKQMTSRWGSCSSNGNISINTDVVCFEQECIDYVVIHELCHLKYMDHSKNFWALAATCCPDYKRLRERMKH